MTYEWIDEKDLVSRLGVTRERLRDARMEFGESAIRVENRAVQWRDDAVRLFMDRIGLQDPTREKDAAPAPEVEELTVCSFPGPDGYHFGQFNIKAKRPSGEVVMVRVLDSTKWRTRLWNNQPMTFPAKKSDGHWWVPLKQPRWLARF